MSTLRLDPYEVLYLMAVLREELDAHDAEDRFYSFGDNALEDLLARVERLEGAEER